MTALIRHDATERRRIQTARRAVRELCDLHHGVIVEFKRMLNRSSCVPANVLECSSEVCRSAARLAVLNDALATLDNMILTGFGLLAEMATHMAEQLLSQARACAPRSGQPMRDLMTAYRTEALAELIGVLRACLADDDEPLTLENDP